MKSHASHSFRLLAAIAMLGVATEAGVRAMFSKSRDVRAPRVCTDCDPIIGILVRESNPTADTHPRQNFCTDEECFQNKPIESEPTGQLSGVIRFEGEPPLRQSADQTGVRRPLFETDKKSGGLRDAVVYLKIPRDRRPQKTPQEPANKKKPPAAKTSIDQKDFTFVPHVVAIQAGEGVKFTNSDVANHNVHGFGVDSKNQFNVFTGGGASHTHRFRAQAGNRPVRIGCDIHPWMSAWVYVFEHNGFAVTDAHGEFSIDRLPIGRHTIAIHQGDGGLTREVEIDVTDDKPAQLEVTFTSDDLHSDEQ